MKIKELLEKGLIDKDHWLLKATVQDENIDIIDGTVLWHDGRWYDGIWEDGSWNDGVWYDGVWYDGRWYDGRWYGGIWNGGIWNDGVWYDGIWKNGVWNDGVWYDGSWNDGVWHGGMWKGGIWLGGATAMKSKYVPLLLSNGNIRIGCKTKTIEQWDLWFASDEEYGTPRDSKEFKMIYAHYIAIKAYVLVMQEGPASVGKSLIRDPAVARFNIKIKKAWTMTKKQLIFIAVFTTVIIGLALCNNPGTNVTTQEQRIFQDLY